MRLALLLFVLAVGPGCPHDGKGSPFPRRNTDGPVAPVPEPSAVVLYGVGALVLGVALRRRS